MDNDLPSAVCQLFSKTVAKHFDLPAIAADCETLTFTDLSTLVYRLACSLPAFRSPLSARTSP